MEYLKESKEREGQKKYLNKQWMMTSKFDETIKKIIPGHILVKLLNTSDKKGVLKASKERDTNKDEDDN